jgi:acetylornithine deacetylase/succinyl-diaminopimelate desuccinylase family protein
MPLTTEEQHLLSKVDALQGELRDLLVDLVRADSVNPPGDTRRASQVCREQLDSFADEVRALECDPIMPNLLATVFSGRSPQLLFNSHIDVVPTGDLSNWHHPPFEAEIVDGVLFGRGAADAKGCMAPMIIAAKSLKQSGLAVRGTLVINPVSDEEVGGIKGAKWLVEQGLVKPDFVVIGEITSNRVAIAHKGIVQFRITTHGRTAHASTPWTGVNAISLMVTLLYHLERELQKRLATRKHPLTPPPSYNLGTIQGGVKVNVVADRCEVLIDRRLIPSEDMNEVIAEMPEIVANVRKEHPAIVADVEVLLKGGALETGADEPLVETARGAARDLAIPDAPVGYEQASDGRFFSELGIPTILIGPGTAHLAHQPDEHIPLEDVYQAARLYALLALRALNPRTV